METRPGDSYWETQVLTAPPAKLRLMLIEGAIRQVQLAQSAWERDDLAAGFQHLSRASDIVLELLSSVRREAGEVGRKVAAMYVFVFQQLVFVQSDRDQQRFEAALRVLQEERETWRTVCASVATSGYGKAAEFSEGSSGRRVAPPPPHHPLPPTMGGSTGPMVGSSLIMDA